MAERKDRELGVQKPFQIRAGLTIRRFGGTNKEGDAGSIGDGEFRTLENVSHNGVFWKCRDGLSKVNSGSAMDGCVLGIWDDGEEIPGVFLIGGSADGTPTLVYVYDSSLSDPGQQLKLPPTETGRHHSMLVIHEPFVKEKRTSDAESTVEEDPYTPRVLFGGTSGRVYIWSPVTVPAGATLLDTAAYPRHILTLPSMGNVTSMGFSDGILYMIANGTGETSVFSFDGEAVVLEETVTNGSNGIVECWDNKVIAAHGGTSNAIRQRASDGTWSGLTLTTTAFVPTDAQEYGDYLYVSGADSGTGTILRIDTDGTVTAPNTAGTNVLALAVRDGTLCYLWLGTPLFTWFGEGAPP